ncbi:unnamed protein product [Cyprideis torosa]|nr:unnamed protein product [Cyprideis torosa]CAG0881337.1 unnamed protein product [Cyprideis torosa]
MTCERLVARGYAAFKELIEKHGSKANLFLFFSGGKTEQGKSWCPDCNVAEPVVNKVLDECSSELPEGAVFIYVDVGDRSVWKDPQCQFRTDPDLKLRGVPTLIRWKSPHKLVEGQCCKEDMISLSQCEKKVGVQIPEGDKELNHWWGFTTLIVVAVLGFTMSSIGTGYDLSASQFSPDGRVFQVEYAQKAVENSGTALGLRCKEGVVFAVEKLVTSKLYETGAHMRSFHIDTHVGMATAGLIADCRQMVQTCRDEAANYRSEYGIPVPLAYLADRVAQYMHAYTLYSAVRPFGCSVLLGSWSTESGAEIYMIDPAGVANSYFGVAIGKAKQNAKTEMEKIKIHDMTLRELAQEAAKIIYTVHDEVKDKEFELELSWIGKETEGRHQFVPADVFQACETYARAALREDESDEEMEAPPAAPTGGS